jgi:hypothetical protein
MKSRRTFLKVLGAGAGGLAAAPLLRAFAREPQTASEYFIFIHQSGGWDVTLWSDPRNESKGTLEPASTATVRTQGLATWQDAPLTSAAKTFRILTRAGHPYGPAIGPSLLAMTDRLCIVNGIAMNTVSHEDGMYFATTGRHLSGGTPVEASIDVKMASELGQETLLPALSVGFPTAFAGPRLNPWAQPVRATDLAMVAGALNRSNLYTTEDDRNIANALLDTETAELARRSLFPEAYESLRLSYRNLPGLVAEDMRSLFDAKRLQAARPNFAYHGEFQGPFMLNAAFALEAIRRGAVRSFSFSLANCDHHSGNYQHHALLLQEAFEMVAQLIRELDTTRFVDSNERLSDHVHILVTSDFCRAPNINFYRGRDHHPTNSALIISPRFKGNFRYGATDVEQLLPRSLGTFIDGRRAITAADVLATFLGAFGIDPRKYMRDGEVMRELLR